MNLLPTPRSTLDLETAFGHVRVYEFGAASADGAAVPVVLLPGRTSGARMWASSLPDLAAARITYPSMPGPRRPECRAVGAPACCA
jgi:pimeloyl-ACP methyl ester carboxylesterase